MTPELADRLRPWRRRVHRHRRGLAAALTFAAVLLGLGAVAPGSSAPGTPSPGDVGLARDLPKGLVAAPVRVADAETTALVRAGDLVDVVAADGRGGAAVVAGGVPVLAVPSTTDSPFGSATTTGALVVVAVPSSTGVALAAASAAGPLSLMLRP